MASLNGIDDLSVPLTPLEREGLAWVELFLTGRATRADLSALAEWRHKSKAHGDAFAAAVKVHKYVAQYSVSEKDHFAPSFLERASTRRSAVLGMAAIGIVGYSAMKPPFGLWPSYAELACDYRTATGEQRKIALSADVSIEMNTGSSVSLPSGPHGVGVDLIKGEIAVSARREFSKPFTVRAGTARILANQGGFNLRYDERGTCVTCLEGRVEIEKTGQRLTLVSRQQVRTVEGGFSRPITVDPEAATAWQRGFIIFHDAALETVVAEINRYRPGRVVIANSSLARDRFSGEFRIERLEDALHQITRVTNASATKLPGGVIVLS